jgi:hypothetical protein
MKDPKGQGYTCGCPEGKTNIKGVCEVPPTNECGDNATKDDNDKCVCNALGATFNEGDCSCGDSAALSENGKTCTCSTPSGSSWTEGEGGKYSCSCPEGKTNVKGVCESLPTNTCGDYASEDGSGNCICKAPGAKYQNDKTCSCGNSAKLSDKGDKCECTTGPTGSVFVGDKNGNYQCRCPDGQTDKNGVCTIEPTNDCGPNASKDKSDACVCYAPGATFNNKKCSCGVGASLSTDGKSCECSQLKGSTWTKDKNGQYSCTCPTGQAPKNGACSSEPTNTCGTDATKDSKGNCVCKAPGARFGTDKKCSCGTNASLVNNACVCSVKDASWKKGSSGQYECVCANGKAPQNGVCSSQPTNDCGKNATKDSKGNCVCAAPGATFEPRDKSCGCGSDAYLGHDGKSCVCSKTGATWTKGRNGGYSCVRPEPQCGRGGIKSNGACVCKAAGATLSKSDNSCSCGGGASLSADGSKCQCSSGSTWTKGQNGAYSCVKPEPQCGRGATKSNGACLCKAPGATLNKSDNSCSCAGGASLSTDGSKCQCSSGSTWTKGRAGTYSCVKPEPQCGRGATKSYGGCVCKAPGATLVKADNSCSCAGGASLSADGSKCQCSSGSTWTKGRNGGYSCVKPEPQCGRGAISSYGGCVCKAPGATLNKSGKSCGCGSHASLSGDGSKCVCSVSGAAWTKGRTGGYSCQCPAGKVERNGACQVPPPSCGRNAYAKNGSCVCKAPGAKFDPYSKSCSCPGATLSSSGDSCQCAGYGTSWTQDGYGKYSCQCPKDQVLKNGSCRPKEPDCGPNAKYSSGSCVCNNSALVYDSRSKSCGCGTDAWLNSKGNGCNCKSSGMLWGQRSHTCACPKGTTYTGGRCQKPSSGGGYGYGGYSAQSQDTETKAQDNSNSQGQKADGASSSAKISTQAPQATGTPKSTKSQG